MAASAAASRSPTGRPATSAAPAFRCGSIANEFRPSRNFRKILARNADIIGEQRSAVPTSEQYSVFRAYLDRRHRHGGMADMTVLDYAMMVEDSHVETRIIEYRKRNIDTGITGRGDELIAVALTDVLSDGLSMVYSFFEPSEQSRSLGTFMILDHITRARTAGTALRLSRLLDRRLQEDGLQGPLPAAAAAGAVRLAARGCNRRSAVRAAGLKNGAMANGEWRIGRSIATRYSLILTRTAYRTAA